MKRAKRHKIKREDPDASTSRSQAAKEHDMAYYIHDRVELMHQVFSVLKPKELKAMAPECVRNISVDDLQELCMEELLGISSKRLCAILDGAEPPSNTSSSDSSPERLETISLDSISSDDEILSQVSMRQSKKHKHRHSATSRSKHKKRNSSEQEELDEQQQADRSRRAGLTVLELLELQARARAIRAQLQQEQAAASAEQAEAEYAGGDSSDGVEIKEEAPEVVEISSEDEKPKLQDLQEEMASRKESDKAENTSTTVTKKIQDLIITIPQNKPSRKIVLKRNVTTNDTEKASEKDKNGQAVHSNKEHSAKDGNRSAVTDTGSSVNNLGQSIVGASVSSKTTKPNDTAAGRSKSKKKQKKKDKKKEKDGSDHDEITLQLSDTEKMDLLEDLDGKKFEKLSSDSEDSVSDSASDDSACKGDKESDGVDNCSVKADTENGKSIVSKESKELDTMGNVEETVTQKEVTNKGDREQDTERSKVEINVVEEMGDCNQKESVIDASNAKIDEDKEVEVTKKDSSTEYNKTEKEVGDAQEESVVESKVVSENTMVKSIEMNAETAESVCHKPVDLKDNSQDKCNDTENAIEVNTINESSPQLEKECQSNVEGPNAEDQEMLNTSDEVCAQKGNETGGKERPDKSDGELSDRDSSEVEACDIQLEVVCISDDDEKSRKKKRKKEKKAKKEKKGKKTKSDFRKASDQNFYTVVVDNLAQDSGRDVIASNEVSQASQSSADVSQGSVTDLTGTKEDTTDSVIELNTSDGKDSITVEDTNTEATDASLESDAYKIFDLSDDSSCYEVEELSVSKEPTTEEIEALSARIDEIEKDGHIDKATDTEVEISWMARYLKSSKVRKVLTTANLFNAIRKKNLELKVKLQQSKAIEENKEVKTAETFVEGSIEQYKTLSSCKKYVDPVKEASDADVGIDNVEHGVDSKDEATDKDTAAKEMKRDARQLVKMYKMLIKYNDMTKQKDPNRKKKKKKSKDKDKRASCQHVSSTGTSVANAQNISVSSQDMNAMSTQETAVANL